MCPNAEEIRKPSIIKAICVFNTICATYVFTDSAVFLDFFGLSLTIEFEDSFPNDSWCDSKSHHQAEFCRFDLTAWNKYIWPLNQQTCVATSFDMALQWRIQFPRELKECQPFAHNLAASSTSLPIRFPPKVPPKCSNLQWRYLEDWYAHLIQQLPSVKPPKFVLVRLQTV